MLCGRLPFDDDHIPLLFKKINGGIYSLPPFLSGEARQLLSRMLIVDSNRRIKISEIRQLEWFKVDLPPYLSSWSTLNHQMKLDKEQSNKEKKQHHSSSHSRNNSTSGEGQNRNTAGGGGVGGDKNDNSPDAPSVSASERSTTEAEEDVDDDDNASPTSATSAGEYIKDVGLVDQEGVEELCSKIPGLTPDSVWELLRNGVDKQLRIAYQLVRDSRSMGIDPRMMAPPPPHNINASGGNTNNPSYASTPTNAEYDAAMTVSGILYWSLALRYLIHATQLQRTTSLRRRDDSTFDEEPDPLLTSNIRILETSLPIPEADQNYTETYNGRPLLRNRAHSPLSGGPAPLTQAHSFPFQTSQQQQQQRTSSPGPNAALQAASAGKKSKIRWHFGIRSRSEPLEVMLEIYRTLKTLGFEWKHKEPEKTINMQDYDDFANEFIGGGGAHHGRNNDMNGAEDAKKRKRREEEEFLKKAQALFFIETRCRLDDVMVRMDLQLYSIDSENYLVDFRNVGYKLLQESPQPMVYSASNARRGSVEDGVGTDEEILASSVNTVRDGGTPSKATRFEDDHLHSSISRSAPSPLKAGSLEGTGGVSTPINSNNEPTMRTRQGSQDATIRQLWEATARAKNQAISGHQSLPNSSLPSSLSSPNSRHHNASTSARRRPGMPRRASSREKGNVSSPFLFLECACRLIVELGELITPVPFYQRLLDIDQIPFLPSSCGFWLGTHVDALASSNIQTQTATAIYYVLVGISVSYQAVLEAGWVVVLRTSFVRVLSLM